MIPFDFNWGQDYHKNKYFITNSNNYVYSMLLLKEWPSNNMALLGSRYSGKTHLSRIWAIENNAYIITKEVNIPSHVSAILVDSLEDFTHNYKDIMHLFYLSLNCKVLWIINQDINISQYSINDIKTRLNSAFKLQMQNPDEELFKKIMIKRAMDFGLDMKEDCAEYIAKRLPITFEIIERIMQEIHLKCLIFQKSITISLIQSLNIFKENQNLY